MTIEDVLRSRVRDCWPSVVGEYDRARADCTLSRSALRPDVGWKSLWVRELGLLGSSLEVSVGTGFSPERDSLGAKLFSQEKVMVRIAWTEDNSYAYVDHERALETALANGVEAAAREIRRRTVEAVLAGLDLAGLAREAVARSVMES